MMGNTMGVSPDGAPLEILEKVPLASRTTLHLGGDAAHLIEADSVDLAIEGIRWARRNDLPVTVIGGGSNIVVADRGCSGLIVQSAVRGVAIQDSEGDILLTASAGEPWDEIVERVVDEGLGGLECLSGIPGLVGATPIQNVGAYGQEVASTIETVRVLDLEHLELRSLSASECGFGYRSSIFRSAPDRFMVVAVSYRLKRGGAPVITYAELSKKLDVRSAVPSPAQIREAVLDLRRGKSMVIDPLDPDSRSVGSFFVNPVVDGAVLAKIEGSIVAEDSMPRFDLGDGRFKLSAAWLIENAGFAKGDRRGGVGISSAHALALVHFGGATTADLLNLARDIRKGVFERFGITLQPEPVFLGFDGADPLG